MAIVVPFTADEPVVGELEPDDGQTKGITGAPPSPLDTYVALGAVTATPLGASTPGLDASVAQAIAADTKNRYFHVRFSCTFHPSGNARFEKAWVLGNLVPGSDGVAPVALSLDPIRSEHPVSLTESFELGVDFKFVSAKATLGNTIPSALIFVEALNEGLDDPAWEFTQTSADRLSGLQRLQMIVRTGPSGAHGTLQLTANVARSEFLTGTYRARFGDRPEIAFDLT